MPAEELPDEFLRPIGSPSNSSLSSNSSDIILINARYARNSRSASISSSTASTQDDSLEGNGAVINANIPNNRHQRDAEDDEMTYQPIKLPTEPTLEELLRQVVGSGDIRSVEQIKLRIISSAISLHRLPYFMPHLKLLNLEGSMLFSLRDLGCDLSALTYLNISRCGLKNFDGTNGLGNLVELVSDFNQIEDAGPCSNLPQIKKISLLSNKIKDFHGVMFLALCSHLKVLDLTNNAITQKENYRDIVKQNIPSLMFLDRVPFEDTNEETKRELLRSAYQPENNGIVQRNVMQTVRVVSSTLNEWSRAQTFDQRLATASPPLTHISIGQRPTTADTATKPKYSLSVGEPVCGSIITKARKPRKLKTAWGESCSSSSFSSSDSSAQGTPVNRTCAASEEASAELLESARQWREKSKQSREKFGK